MGLSVGPAPAVDRRAWRHLPERSGPPRSRRRVHPTAVYRLLEYCCLRRVLGDHLALAQLAGAEVDEANRLSRRQTRADLHHWLRDGEHDFDERPAPSSVSIMLAAMSVASQTQDGLRRFSRRLPTAFRRESGLIFDSTIRSKAAGVSGRASRPRRPRHSAHPTHWQNARPMTSSSASPLSHGRCSVNMVLHSLQLHARRVMSVPQNERVEPKASTISRT